MCAGNPAIRSNFMQMETVPAGTLAAMQREIYELRARLEHISRPVKVIDATTGEAE